MRPFFPFYGSKWNLAKHYPEPTGTVVEPFAGSACYSVWHEAERVILVDADPNITAVWEYLIRATPDAIMALPDLPNQGDGVEGLDPGPAALIGFWLTKSAAPVRRRAAYASRPDMVHNFWRPQIKERIASQLEKIRGWSVIGGDYTLAPRIEDATYFVDPPYQIAGRHYRVSFSGHQSLGTWVQHLPGRVIACEGPNADWLPFHNLGQFKTFTKGVSREMVWIR